MAQRGCHGGGLVGPGHIFLIFRYRRMSGTDMTASTPRVAAAAIKVTAVMYPSVRIAGLLVLRLINVSRPRPPEAGAGCFLTAPLIVSPA